MPLSRRDDRIRAFAFLVLALEAAWPLAALADRTTPDVLTVRAHASADYLAQTIEGERRFRDTVERTNRLIEPWLHVRFQIVEFRRWNRQSTKATLAHALAELEREDGGDDVDLVVGLVSGLPVAPTAIDVLGMAHLLGRHVVLRAIVGLDVARVRRGQDGASPAAQLEAIHECESTLLLHESAHTLGAIHSSDETSIMSPWYSGRQIDFDPPNRQIVALMATRKRSVRAAGERLVVLSDLRAILDRYTATSFGQPDRQALLAEIQKRLDKALEDQTPFVHCRFALHLEMDSITLSRDLARTYLAAQSCRQDDTADRKFE